MNKTLENIVKVGIGILAVGGCRSIDGEIGRWVKIESVEITNKVNCDPLSWVEDYVERCETGIPDDNCIEDPLCVKGDNINIAISVGYFYGSYSSTNMSPAPINEISEIILNEYTYYDKWSNPSELWTYKLDLRDTFDFEYVQTESSLHVYEASWVPSENNMTCSENDEEDPEFYYLLTGLVEYTIPLEEDYSVTTQKEENITPFTYFIYDHNCLE